MTPARRQQFIISGMKYGPIVQAVALAIMATLAGLALFGGVR
jgi:hypothetical protein